MLVTLRAPARFAPLALVALGAVPASAQGPVPGQDWVVPAGSTVVYDTLAGRVHVKSLTVEPGATLRVVGPNPFFVVAKGTIRVEGHVSLDGDANPGVSTLNTANQPEPGAAGQAGGGAGGVGSPLVTQSTPVGGAGSGSAGHPSGAGAGGESGFGSGQVSGRRPGGGGGGALGPNRPVHPNPTHPSNRGLVALPGFDGSPSAIGAVSLTQPPRGGAPGATPFVDGNPRNDFCGKLRLPGGAVVVGELAAPLAGSGGGAGGDAVPSTTFPSVPFTPASDEKGAGGGGGGGLGLFVARRIVIRGAGRITADGGDGGGGENTLFFDRVGGGSGGGSGGFLVLEAPLIDLSQANVGALSARGGAGGPGANDVPYAINAGGDGGPGLIQLHTPTGTSQSILTNPAAGLSEISAPDALVLFNQIVP